MSDLVKSVGEKVSKDSCTNRCRKGNCKVVLSKELYPRVVIDLDHCEELASKNDRRCDYIIIGDICGDDLVIPLELTGGRKDASEIVAQLQAGALIAKKVVRNNLEFKFRPVFAYRGFRKGERDALRNNRNRVSFWGKRELVRVIKCGNTLSKAFLVP